MAVWRVESGGSRRCSPRCIALPPANLPAPQPPAPVAAPPTAPSSPPKLRSFKKAPEVDFANPAGSVEFVATPAPTPAPRDGECTVKLLCRPVNPADLFVMLGVYPGAPPSLKDTQAAVGLEAVGVVEVSKDPRVPVGSRVAVGNMPGQPGKALPRSPAVPSLLPLPVVPEPAPPDPHPRSPLNPSQTSPGRGRPAPTTPVTA